MQNKLGFWALFSLVIGSQIGSGVFLLPASLSLLGHHAIIGWLVSGFGALSLTMVFIQLVERFPKTGGPHVYVLQAFGNTAAFFTGWTYWLISTLSSATVILAAVGYLIPLTGPLSPTLTVVLSLTLLGSVLILNLRGVASAGSMETFLALVKVFTLVVIPCLAFTQFDYNNIITAPQPADAFASLTLIGKSSLLTLWAFIGLESATAPAESIENPRYTIPAAMISGTSCVLILYLLNSIALQGLIPAQSLALSSAPYVDAATILLGWPWIVSAVGFFASLVCLSNLNAWVLTSGQIALGLAQENFLPPFFKKLNQQGAPKWGLCISCFLIVPLVFTSMNASLISHVSYIIEVSVTAFLFVYLACSLGLLKILMQENKPLISLPVFFAVSAIFFCLALVLNGKVADTMTAGVFVASGLPVYWLHYRKHVTTAPLKQS